MRCLKEDLVYQKNGSMRPIPVPTSLSGKPLPVLASQEKSIRVLANSDGVWINGVQSPGKLLVLVKGCEDASAAEKDDPDSGWLFVDSILLIDTASSTVVRVVRQGPFLTQLCPWLYTLAVVDGGCTYGEKFSGTLDNYPWRVQREIVLFDRELFRLYMLEEDGTRRLLEV